MVQLYPPVKFLWLLIFVGLSNGLIAQSGFFMPLQLDTYETFRVQYNDHDRYHNVKVKSINFEIPGQVTVIFEDMWSFSANPISRTPFGYGPVINIGGLFGCAMNPDMSTVLGKSVKILSDSTWIFDLGQGSSFTVMTQASVGENWEAYPLLNGSGIWGQMLSVIQGQLPDEWIKTIKLEAHINPDLLSGIFPFHPIIKFSTKRGLLEIPQLSNFMFTPPGYYVDTFPILKIYNSNEEFHDSDFRKFNFRNVFDLQPGDIIVSQRNQNGNISRQHIEVLKSDWASDHSSVDFTWHLKTYNVSAENEQSLTSDRIVDTTLPKNDFWQSLDSFPPLITFANSDTENIPLVNAVISRSNSNYYNRRQFFQRYHELGWDHFSQCYHFIQFSNSSVFITEYVDGLGGPYRYSYSSGLGGSSTTSERIEYYKKGEEEWGDPGVLTSFQNISSSSNSLRISPTLASSGSELYVSHISQNIRISVLNLQGVVMPVQERKSENGSFIQLTDFKPGMYIVNVFSPDGAYSSGKIMVF